MSEQFPILIVPPDSADVQEQMGTKFKFWFDDPERGRCLFKEPRPNTGEDWAEKVAAELCRLLDLPHAQYELATWRNQRGTITPMFVPKGGTLIHGNELMWALFESEGYPKPSPGDQKFRRVPQHTIPRVLRAIRARCKNVPLGWNPSPSITTPIDVFIGYLLLDAWISNTDRHHQNWGLYYGPTGERGSSEAIHLAPTFDHASSLGSHLTDENRQVRLLSKDRGYNVFGYAERGLSAFYPDETAKKPLSTLDAFRLAAREQPNAAIAWLNLLARVSAADVDAMLQRVPDEVISSVARQFAIELLAANRLRLMALTEELH